MDNSRKPLDQSLLQAYSRTIYRVQKPLYSIEVSQPNDDLDVFLIDNQIYHYAFITAVNPQSQPLNEAENTQRMVALKRLLQTLGFRYCEAVHIDPAKEWPDEASYFILDISRQRAEAIGYRFGQHAIVWGGYRRPAQIVPCGGNQKPD